jgi:uncharacterized protein
MPVWCYSGVADPGISRCDWLLLLLDRETLGASGPEALDPIRVQKGLFLLSQRGPAAALYEFRPYNWGPFSSDVYSDLDDLTARGYLAGTRVPGRSWSTYTVTTLGHQRAGQVAARVGAPSVGWLRSAREFLTTRSFPQLLRDIYAAYPEFARNSHFAG